jgi:hypothetical protein
VGDAFGPGWTSAPTGAFVEISPGGVLLWTAFPDVTPMDVTIVATGRFSMRLLEAPHTLTFLYRFGDGDWSDTPYSVHRVPEDQRRCPPPPEEGAGWPLRIALIEGRTGIVLAVRDTALTRSFSMALLAAYERQTAVPADDAAHAREVLRTQRKSGSALAQEALTRFETVALAN